MGEISSEVLLEMIKIQQMQLTILKIKVEQLERRITNDSRTNI